VPWGGTRLPALARTRTTRTHARRREALVALGTTVLVHAPPGECQARAAQEEEGVHHTDERTGGSGEPGSATMALEPGCVYKGQIVVERGETLVIEAPREAAGSTSPTCWLEHVTSVPYEPVIRVLPGGTCKVEGRGCLGVRHGSPSVASNFAIEVDCGASLTLNDTMVTSATGTGIGIEGASACSIQRCVIRDCKEHGVAAYDDIETGAVGGVVHIVDTDITGCKGYGVLARGEGVRVSVSRSRVSGGKQKYNSVAGSEITETL